MTNSDYEYNYSEKVRRTLKRVKITFDYHNEANLDAMLAELREELLSGSQRIDKTVKYAAKCFLIYGEQNYRNPRDYKIEEKDGIKYQLISSRI